MTILGTAAATDRRAAVAAVIAGTTDIVPNFVAAVPRAADRSAATLH